MSGMENVLLDKTGLKRFVGSNDKKRETLSAERPRTQSVPPRREIKFNAAWSFFSSLSPSPYPLA